MSTTINDFIGVDWSDELVHYPVAFRPGELQGEPTFRATVDGQSVGTQVTDVVRYQDGSLKACNVWLFVDVAADGGAKIDILHGAPNVDPNGVAVRQTEQGIELLTNGPHAVGIRLPNVSAQYDWPVSATEVPGPIAGLLLPSGRWIGEGRFEVPFKVKSVRTAILTEGPLFADVQVKYQFDVGWWAFTARVLRDHPFVIVREALDTGWNEQAYDDVDRFYSLRLNGDGFQPTQAFYTGKTDSDVFTSLLKTSPQAEIAAVSHQPAASSGTLVSGYDLQLNNDQTNYYMIGWPCWSPRVGVATRFVEPTGDAVGFVAMDTPSWKNQMSIRFKATADGGLDACFPLQVYEQDWPTDGYGRTSPNATGKTLNVPDTTARRTYGIMLSPAEDETEAKLGSLLAMASKIGAWRLDDVKDWVLDWPDPMADADWADEPTDLGKKAVERMRTWVAAKQATGNFGLFSMHDYRIVTHWRFHPRGMGQADLADLLDDTSILTAEQRQTLRHLAAYQAYVMNSRDVFPWGSGAHLGNPNMSIMAMEARVFSSNLISDHPMFNTWGRWTTQFMRGYIARFTRESGAPYECPHYTLGVTLKDLASANRVLMDAGIGDAFEGSRLADSLRFSFNWLLPEDLRFNGYRTIMPIGNTSYQSVPPDMAQMMIAYFHERDPELASQMQWFANQTLSDDKKMDMVEESVPELKSRHYEDYGVFFRHGFGTPHETYFHMMAGNCLGHYEQTDHMVYTLYAKGHPINLHFGNGYFPMLGRPWLRNGISVDHRRHGGYERLYADVKAAALADHTDYVHAALDIDELLPECSEHAPPYGTPDTTAAKRSPKEKIPRMTWHRQVMFLKDADPKGPNYFVIRDTFGGRPVKPTDANFWFLADTMQRNGSLFHFNGRLPVDMDVFVNTPEDVEYETAEFAHEQRPYGRFTGENKEYFIDGKRQEKQLCLRLKQPAGGDYMVVLYPRLKDNDPPATFARLTDSAVRVETAVSTDYVILDSFPVEFSDDRVAVRGQGVAIRFLQDGTVKVINSEGAVTVTVAGTELTGNGAFTATLRDGKTSWVANAEGAHVDTQAAERR